MEAIKPKFLLGFPAGSSNSPELKIVALETHQENCELRSIFTAWL